jgi:hypothetical protein
VKNGGMVAGSFGKIVTLNDLESCRLSPVCALSEKGLRLEQRRDKRSPAKAAPTFERP